MKYKAIIFDLFGTLVDSYDLLGYASALRETSSLLKMRHEDFHRLWQETGEKRITGGFNNLEENLEYIYNELGLPVNKFDIRLAKMVRMDYIGISLTPRKYAIETVSELKKTGYKLGLISNCGYETPDLWPNSPFAPFFDTAVFSSKCGLQKPDPRIFQLAVEQLGLKPEDCLFVDDNGNNLDAAKKLGIGAVQIEYPEETERPYMTDAQDEWNGPKITSIEQVLDVLEE